MADNKFHTAQVLANMQKLKTQLPVVLANQAKNFFTASWKNEGWEGKKWETPKRKIPGETSYKYPFKGADARHTRATLVQSGKLRRAAGMSIRTVSFERTTLIVDLPYAKVHNEGGEHTPRRQYMGDSPTLRKDQGKKINQYIGKIWQA